MSDPRTAGVREQKERTENKRESGQSMEFTVAIMEELRLIRVNV